ncbi:hypothetical protein [Thalassospira sp.]|uniref:hypothetical protein n=1 Tax=Thalassospira sp. TaxID=1912094 RepID=UPI003AA8E0BF
MSQFNEEIKLFSEADRRLEVYPSMLQDLLSHLKAFVERGVPLVKDASEPLWHPDDVEHVKKASDFFERQGVDHLRMISNDYKAALGKMDLERAMSFTSGLGGLHRAWHNYLADIYQSDIFPPPSSYLSDIDEKLYEVFPVYQGPRQKSFEAYLHQAGNPWAKYAQI